MTNLSDLLPAGAASKQLSFTASGAIAQGKPVILNTNGTVTQVTGDSATEAVGTPATFQSGEARYINATFDSSNNKVVFAYRDISNSNYGTAVVGTPASDNSITFGTPVVFNSGTTENQSPVFDSSNNKVVIAYTDGSNSDYGTCVVGTVSGTSISFGSEVVFRSSTADYIRIVFDSSNNKVVIIFRDAAGAYGGAGNAIVGEVSGTSMSFGTKAIFDSGNTQKIAATFDSSNNKVVIAYVDGDDSQLKSIVGTVSGTGITYGSAATIYAGNVQSHDDLTAAFDASANKVVVAYKQSTNGYGYAQVGTVSGTSISYGSAVLINGNNDTAWLSATYDSAAEKTTIAYRDGGNSYYGTVIVGTVSGTSISFGTEVVFESATTSWITSTYDSNLNKVVIGYRDQGNSNYGTGVVFQVGFDNTNLTATNFLGIADEAISNGASGNVTMKGGIASSGLSSLTPGSTYYVQRDGTLATSAATPSVEAGKAMSATSINLDYST
jgi:hypothetical protein